MIKGRKVFDMVLIIRGFIAQILAHQEQIYFLQREMVNIGVKESIILDTKSKLQISPESPAYHLYLLTNIQASTHKHHEGNCRVA